ncbi:MAG: ATP-grasp domain-containing protein [Capsulimonadales bacterium]|nr:ATP-grasp domain-containing protein [Capsulimonadales bacterium]
MKTLILSSRYSDDSRLLWQAAIKRGWQVMRLRQWNLPESDRPITDPILYVEALTAPFVADQLGVTLIEPALDWLPRLPERYRKRSIELTTLGKARRGPLPAFVKPPNDKSFPAAVYSSETIPTDFPEDMPVLVSEIVTFDQEFRCFVSDRELRTFSLYARKGEHQANNDWTATAAEEGELFRFVHELLEDRSVELPPAVAIDVGIIPDRGWAVVEANPVWGAGIYGCSPSAVLDVLNRSHDRCPSGEV